MTTSVLPTFGRRNAQNVDEDGHQQKHTRRLLRVCEGQTPPPLCRTDLMSQQTLKGEATIRARCASAQEARSSRWIALTGHATV